eukprot:5733839-Amphidinium_carterae.1
MFNNFGDLEDSASNFDSDGGFHSCPKHLPSKRRQFGKTVGDDKVHKTRIPTHNWLLIWLQPVGWPQASA